MLKVEKVTLLIAREIDKAYIHIYVITKSVVAGLHLYPSLTFTGEAQELS